MKNKSPFLYRNWFLWKNIHLNVPWIFISKDTFFWFKSRYRNHFLRKDCWRALCEIPLSCPIYAAIVSPIMEIGGCADKRCGRKFGSPVLRGSIARWMEIIRDRRFPDRFNSNEHVLNLYVDFGDTKLNADLSYTWLGNFLYLVNKKL